MAVLTGDSGDNILTGGADNDTINGKAGNDTLTGNGGNDLLVGNSGSDILDGGEGDDRLFAGDESPAFSLPYYENPYTPPLLDSGNQVDTLDGGDGSDRLFAGYGDNVDGGANGSYGDYLYISFMGAPAGVTVDFRLGTQVIGGGTIMGIENISWVQGSNFDDQINAGSAYNNGYSDFTAVFGMGGNDQLIAGYYAGVLDGGEGDDVVDGRGSQYLQAVYGGAGNDTVYTNSNTFGKAYGGAGNDTIYSHGETYGGDGNDVIVITFSYYSARVYGEAGNDHITGADGVADQIAGGAGADTIAGGSGNDQLGSGDFGTYPVSFADDVGIEFDWLVGNGGDDLLSIGYGDSADGGIGNDTLRLSLAGFGAGITFSTAGIVSGQSFSLGAGLIEDIEILQYLRGTDFADSLTLATQSSLLAVDAGAGDDVVTSQNSSVSVLGGAGNDHFVSGAAGDTWQGGLGNDTIDYSLSSAGVIVTLGSGGTTVAGPGGDQLSTIENIVGTSFADTLNGNDLANMLQGQAGDDTLSGAAGSDTLDGGAGEDILRGGTGNDIYIVDASDAVEEAIDGGHDTARSPVTYVLAANVEVLLLTGSANVDGTGNSLDNWITGNSGSNSLHGLGGNDTLTGGSGDDLLDGGAGNDTFLDTAANLNGDTLTDFSAGDRIVISDADLASFTFSISGNTLTFTGGSLTLGTVPAGQLVAKAASGGGVQLGIAPPPIGPALNHSGDTNGDGRSDILWRHESGLVMQWLGQANGGFAASAATYQMPTDWNVAGIGDLNGDNRDDIVWRSDSGNVVQWLGQTNGSFASSAATYQMPTDWNVAGIGDLNGDNRDDIVWRSDSGTVVQWLGQANGSFAASPATYQMPTNWHVAAIGDLNGDTRADIVWRADSGTVTQWLGQANGSFAASVATYEMPTSWRIEGSGDINGDNLDDLIWRNDSGTIMEWLGQANGSFAASAATYQMPMDWQVASTGDFNGDHRDDLLWRHESGVVMQWLGQTDGSFAASSATYQMPTDWHVQPSFLF